MTDQLLDQFGRPEPDPASSELVTLLGFLDYQRATLEWKCRGLDSDGLNFRLASSTISLGGLLKHLAYVENHWFSNWLFDRETLLPWRDVDWNLDHDWDWNSAANDTSIQLFELWNNSTALSRELVAQALTAGGLDQLAKRTWPSGESPSLRWIIVHMIEEYARHNGHADLLRQAFDGQVGE